MVRFADLAVVAGNVTLFVDFGAPSRRLNTSATVQVVTSPLLERSFTVNGTVVENPIYDAAWSSLAQLGVEHARFQPWFPFPRKAVAELYPPDGGGTHWDFRDMVPQLAAFANASSGRSINLNIATHPCWLFANRRGPSNHSINCHVPSDPNQMEFNYGTIGKRDRLVDPSGSTLAHYFARTFAYLSTGRMVDEAGRVHAGGPALNLSTRGSGGAAMSTWEVFNEGEHSYNVEQYTHDYDEIVRLMRREVGEAGLPRLIGIGGCINGFWSWWIHGSCAEWIPYFLNRSNHAEPNVPIDYVSIHYYANSNNRSVVETYTPGFFGGVDGFVADAPKNVADRDRFSPSTRLAITEAGTLFADDELVDFGADGGVPDLFWNAGGAMLAYMFGRLANLGFDILTFSQLLGSPPIPQWGVNNQQFPSASLLDWRTGHGTAKYWAIRLLTSQLKPGDRVLPEARILDSRPPRAGAAVFCAEIGGWTFSGEAHLKCDDPTATIESVDFADYGLPTGICGEYAVEPTCSTRLRTRLVLHRKCVGRRSCRIQKDDLPGLLLPGRYARFGPQPCPIHEALDPVRVVATSFKAQVRCSRGTGRGTGALQYEGDRVFAVGFEAAAGGFEAAGGGFEAAGGGSEAADGALPVRKVLLINKEMVVNTVTLVRLDASGGTLHSVEPNGAPSSAHGIRTRRVDADGSTRVLRIALPPFAVAMLVLDPPAARAPSAQRSAAV